MPFSRKMRHGKSRILEIDKSAIRNPVVDIAMFSYQTLSGLSYARHIEADLILLLPDRLHPLCTINHRSARFTIKHLCIYVRLALAAKVGAD
jgi:hypothetical protein